MAKLVAYVDELVQEVGPRPAGTQQEHQAAELIASRLDEFGLNVEIEEFSCARNMGWVRVLYYGLCAAGAAVMIFSPGLHIVGAIAIIIGAVLMVLDHLGKNPLFSLISTSLSQNVIARYEPEGADSSGRSKKVVILAHYDTARTMVQASPLLVKNYSVMRSVVRYGIIALMVFAILLLMPFPPIVITVISVIAGVLSLSAAIPLVAEIVNFFMPYNQGANCNGSGIGAIYGLATALTTGGESLQGYSASRRDGTTRKGAGRRGSSRGDRSERGKRRERTVDELELAATDARAGRNADFTGDIRSGRVRPRGGFDKKDAEDISSDESGQNQGFSVSDTEALAGGLSSGAKMSVDAGAAAAAMAAAAVGAGIGASVEQASAAIAGGEKTDAAQSGTEAESFDLHKQIRDLQGKPSFGSVGNDLSSPFITQRSPRGEAQTEQPIDGKNTAQSVDEMERLAMQDGMAEEASNRSHNTAQGASIDASLAGKPAWFVKAKLNAEKKLASADNKETVEDGDIVRSQFADVPVSGRAEVETAENDQVHVERSRFAEPQLQNKAAPIQPHDDQQTQEQEQEQQQEQAQAQHLDGQQISDQPNLQAREHFKAQLKEQELQREAALAAQQKVVQTPNTDYDRGYVPNTQQQVSPEESHQAVPDVDRQIMPEVIATSSPAYAVPIVQNAPQVHQDILETKLQEQDRNTSSVRESDIQQQLSSQEPTPQDAPSASKDNLAGIDRQAFSVLPASDSGASKVIVPSQEASHPQTGSSEPAKRPGLGQGLRSRLRNLPSLSLESTGNIPAQQATLHAEPVAKEEIFSDDSSVVSSTGAFVPLGTTGVMRPVGTDLLEYHNGKEIYVDDADDTSISEHYSQTGEYTEPELVQIPNSRMKSFLGSVGDRLTGKKKEKLDDSPSSWLGVDERYDARKEGHEIGSWDNFNEKKSDNDNWNGGAYGGGTFEENVDAMMSASNVLLDKEVWLVALGANESKNVGLANLFENHGSELKNALFINLVGVGTGDLVFTISEGNFRPIQTDHRMQNLVSSAAQDMAIPIGPVAFNAFNTDATEALKHGGRAISIMGLGNKVPLGWRWSDDEVSRLREDNLVDVVSLVLEVIKNS